MRFPCLVDRRFCKTPIELILYQEGIGEDGEPIEALKIKAMCNYQDKAKSVLTADRQLVQLSAQAYFIGDIAPNLPNISSGKAIINGVERQIYQGEKARNPDGTVNYTRLDLV